MQNGTSVTNYFPSLGLGLGGFFSGCGCWFFLLGEKQKKGLHRVTFASEQRKGSSFPHHKQRGHGGRATGWAKQTAPAGANAPKKSRLCSRTSPCPCEALGDPQRAFFSPSLPSMQGTEPLQPLPRPGSVAGPEPSPARQGLPALGTAELCATRHLGKAEMTLNA